ncbi:MAG: sigma-54-dependent transcriptional regulator [Planctomycetota bacterium]|jgi:DNA-binding NtrC family response regulator
MAAEHTILLVDDDASVRGLIRAEFRSESVAIEEREDCRGANERIAGEPTDIVFLDLQLPDGSGLDLIPPIREAWPDTPVVLITGHGSIESAVEAMDRGAFTYLEKPFQEGELVAVMHNALETGRLQRQRTDRKQRNEEDFGFGSLLCESRSMQELVERARAAASSPASTILLLGESGTGKGLLARAIHAASDRAAEPFLTVTCSAIPEPLLEAKLFGHEAGAFTDAKTSRKGVFEEANGGTVFLDEVGDMPLTLQAKLLGVLEDRVFTRVGSNDEHAVDVRILAATHRDLESRVANGEFREDLLYRINVVPLVLPPMRERRADILPLARLFVAKFNAEFARAVEGISEEGEAKLLAHAWPGNVRELRNVIERAMLFVDGDVLDAPELTLESGYHPTKKKSETAAPATSAAAAPDAPGFQLPEQGVNLEELENDLIRQAMERSDGVKAHAASLLGLTRDQIRTRLKRLED